MKLTGIIEDVFRGVTIFRGYATLKTLARLSASTSYQRDKDPDITYSNPNVLYELGRVHALRKNCIIVKSDIDSGTSSDIRNIRHYLYKSNSKSTTLLSEVKKNIVAYLDTIV